jgi:DNA-binding MarR family transcriptional regulator
MRVANNDMFPAVATPKADDDDRAVVVVPTARGRHRLERLGATARATLREIYQGFDEPELGQLADLLERLVAGLDALLDDPG